MSVRTSGDGQEESKLLEKQLSEAAKASLAKSNNEKVNNLGKKLLSNHLRRTSSTSSSAADHLLFLDPSESPSSHVTLPLVEPKGRKIYLIPKLSARFTEKMSTASISLNRKKLKLVPVEPYTACCTPLIVPIAKALDHRKPKYSRNNLRVSELMAHLKMQEELAGTTKPADATADLQADKEKLEKQLLFQIQVNAELKGLLVHCLGEDLQAKVNNLTEDKMKIASSLSSNTEKIEFLSSQAEVWRSKFLASSLLLEELSKMKTELSQRNAALAAHNKELQIGMDKLRIGLIETHQNLSFLSNESVSNAKSSNCSDLMNECVTLSRNLALTSGKLGLPRQHENLIGTFKSTTKMSAGAAASGSHMMVNDHNIGDTQVFDEVYQAVCNQAQQEYKRDAE